MADSDIRYYILFENYEQGLALHDLLTQNGLKNRIAPAPRAIQGKLSCGMSLLLGIHDADVADDACVQAILENGCDMAVADTISQHATMKKLIPVGKKFGYYDNDAVLFLKSSSRSSKASII